MQVCNNFKTVGDFQTERLGQVTQQLQVTACVLRKAMRSAAKHLASLLQVRTLLLM